MIRKQHSDGCIRVDFMQHAFSQYKRFSLCLASNKITRQQDIHQLITWLILSYFIKDNTRD